MAFVMAAGGNLLGPSHGSSPSSHEIRDEKKTGTQLVMLQLHFRATILGRVSLKRFNWSRTFTRLFVARWKKPKWCYLAFAFESKCQLRPIPAKKHIFHCTQSQADCYEPSSSARNLGQGVPLRIYPPSSLRLICTKWISALKGQDSKGRLVAHSGPFKTVYVYFMKDSLHHHVGSVWGELGQTKPTHKRLCKRLSKWSHARSILSWFYNTKNRKNKKQKLIKIIRSEFLTSPERAVRSREKEPWLPVTRSRPRGQQVDLPLPGDLKPWWTTSQLAKEICKQHRHSSKHA